MGRVRVRVDVARQVGLFVGLLAALALSLFLPAGTVAWPVGWIFLGSFALLFLTFRENAYLSPVVRIQGERGHTVVSTGPYRHVRHPMYAAIVVFVVGTSLLLGSWSGLLVGSLFVVLLAWRAVLEERTLRRELPGYARYMARVRYRLVPRVW